MQTIEQQAARLIAKGKSNVEIAKAIRAKNRGAKTSPGSVAWYRSRLAKAGPKKAIAKPH